MKWSQERINAYMRYVEHDKAAIKRWEWSLQDHLEGVKRAESALKSYKESLEKTIQELSEQGIELD